MKFRPLHDRVVLRRIEEDERTRAASSFPTLPRKSHSRAKLWPLDPVLVTRRAWFNRST